MYVCVCSLISSTSRRAVTDDPDTEVCSVYVYVCMSVCILSSPPHPPREAVTDDHDTEVCCVLCVECALSFPPLRGELLLMTPIQR